MTRKYSRLDGNSTSLCRRQIAGHRLDAPWHFHSTMNKGEGSITVDEVPLEWCFQPGVKNGLL
jgi:hypothetical protein